MQLKRCLTPRMHRPTQLLLDSIKPACPGYLSPGRISAPLPMDNIHLLLRYWLNNAVEKPRRRNHAEV